MPVIIGDDSDQTLGGGAGRDVIRGRAGTDAIDGLGGNDTLEGGSGADTVRGGEGDDVLYGFGSTDVNARSGQIIATRVGDGFDSPLFAASAPGDPDRLFVVEQHSGRVMILDPAGGAVEATPFLDIPDGDLAGGGEQGLLGLAFHPDYARNGKLYVNLTNAAGDIEVWEYTRSAGDADRADPASARLVLTFDHPQSNHNGGWMGFGPDGHLYIASGDGGGDPDNNAQNIDSLLGKILRIDVDGDDFADPDRNYAIPDDNPFVGAAGADEIWAYGLRNPWRPSFDRATGDFWIADVGQGVREEVNFVPAGEGEGWNFGWRIREGDLPYSGETGSGLVDPVLVYGHGDGPFEGQSITGGYVYRGPGGGQGLYVFADFVSGNLWTTQQAGGETVDFINRNSQIEVDAGSLDLPASFAEDGRGRLYVIGLDGEVHRLDFSAAAGDGADILDGGAGDDRIYGGVGDDRAAGGVGDDLMWGGLGRDRLTGDDGRDRLDGGLGADDLAGGRGDDVYVVDDAADVARETAGGGADTVLATLTWRLGAELEELRLVGSAQINGVGNGLSNRILGNERGNVIVGGGLNDYLWGRGGIDRFDVNAVSESSFSGYDRILDLEDQDVIDLSTIDADTAQAGNQSFVLVEALNGQARQLSLTWNAAAGFTVLAADVDGDGVADMRMVLYGRHDDFDGFRL